MKLTFPAALGLLFIGLKLAGYITWPWLWVLAPFWISLALVAAYLLFFLVVILLAAAFGWKDFSR